MEYPSSGAANPGKDEEPAQNPRKRDRQLLLGSSAERTPPALRSGQGGGGMGQQFPDREGRRALGQQTEEPGSPKKSWETACKGSIAPACSSEGREEGQGSPLGLGGRTVETGAWVWLAGGIRGRRGFPAPPPLSPEHPAPQSWHLVSQVACSAPTSLWDGHAPCQRGSSES